MLSIHSAEPVLASAIEPQKNPPLSIQQHEAPLGKESITKRLKAGFRARGRRVRMTGCGNQEHAEG